MPGSLTAGIPDYVDPYQRAQQLLSSPRRRDREKGEHMLRLLESQQNRQLREQQFNETAQAREDARSESAAQRQIQQEQLNTYREGLLAEKERSNQAQQVETLRFLLADPNTPEPVKQAIQQRMLAGAGVQATIPADPKMVALANATNAERAKQGLPPVPVPQGTTVGGPAPIRTSGATQPQKTSQESGDVAKAGFYKSGGARQTSATTYDPELGANVAEFGGGQRVALGAPDPSVGALDKAIGTELGPHTYALRNPATGSYMEGSTRRSAAEAIGPNRVNTSALARGNPAPNENIGAPTEASPWSPAQLASQPKPSVPSTAPPLPSEPGSELSSAQPAIATKTSGGIPVSAKLANLNEQAGIVGEGIRNVTEPFAIAKNAIGSLFSGGQGGANQIVGGATPAPGTEFQGPLTAAADFAKAPLAPTPTPAGTPPAQPRPQSEEERKRLMAAQY